MMKLGSWNSSSLIILNSISEFVISFESMNSMSGRAACDCMHTVLLSKLYGLNQLTLEKYFATHKAITNGNSVYYWIQSIFIHHSYKAQCDIQRSVISLENTIGSSWDVREKCSGYNLVQTN